MKHHNRRTILKSGAMGASSAAFAAALPDPLLATLYKKPEPVDGITDPKIRELAFRAIDSAKLSGATYADIRLTHQQFREISGRTLQHREGVTVGIRALVDGYWGFAAGAVWNTDEMVKLGRIAVELAKACTGVEVRSLDLGTVPVVKDGHWDMPVINNPFTMNHKEIQDYLMALMSYNSQQAAFHGLTVRNLSVVYQCTMEAKAFASTEGSYCTQRTFLSSGQFSQALEKDGAGLSRRALGSLTPAGVGWELFSEQPVRDQIKDLMEDTVAELSLPMIPADVGRMNAVLDAMSVAKLLSKSIGLATELDRVFGYEANASGTSYISDPLEMRDTFKVGSSLVNISGNRTEAGGASTVRWDDEGVEPKSMSLVKDGVLTGFAMDRSTAGLTAQLGGVSETSNGCARVGMDAGNNPAAGGGVNAPLIYSPNIRMEPGSKSNTYESLVGAMSKGIAFEEMNFEFDFQQLNALGWGRAYEIRNGKAVARINDAAILLRAPEFWKSVTDIGGPESARKYGEAITKGEPPQNAFHTVTSVPASYQDVTVIDRMRRA